MKLYSSSLELTAIKSICKSDKRLSAKLLGSINKDYFYSDPAKEAISRILTLIRKESEVPSFSTLCSDPVISESNREVLKKHSDYIKEPKELKKTLKNLFKYKQARDLYFLSEKINESLTQDNVDVEKLLEFTVGKVSKMKNKLSTEQEFFHFGKSYNSDSIVKRMLDNNKAKVVPTGFNDFDKVNGGFAWGSLVAFGGPAGGGKTALALQVALNIALKFHEDVVYIPLEMSEEETCERIFSNLSGIPAIDIKNKKLSTKQKEKLLKTEKRFTKKLKKYGNRFTIYNPYDGLTMTDALLAVRPYGFKVVILDYLGLLEGVDGEAQWQKLGEAAREAKLWAKANNAIVIVLAQLDDKDHILRYSKVLKDHANNLWTWLMTDEARENKIMEIHQGKARNQKMFPFTLSFDDDLYKVFDHRDSAVSLNSGSKKSDYLDTVED
jgi:replicative DNA helicase